MYKSWPSIPCINMRIISEISDPVLTHHQHRIFSKCFFILSSKCASEQHVSSAEMSLCHIILGFVFSWREGSKAGRSEDATLRDPGEDSIFTIMDGEKNLQNVLGKGILYCLLYAEYLLGNSK